MFLGIRRKLSLEWDDRFAAAGDTRIAERRRGGVIFVPSSGRFYVANHTALSIWHDIVLGRTLGEICTRVHHENEVSLSAARNDVQEVLTQLCAAKLIQRRRRVYTPRYLSLTCLAALIELARYDIGMALFGFAPVQAALQRKSSAKKWCVDPAGTEEHIKTAASSACGFYWKPARCLQRSVVLVRLLRRFGISAELIIGYREAPFHTHAWVDVNGRVVNDSPSYASRLSILYRI